MDFNVSQLLREPIGSTRDYVIEPEGSTRRGRVELIRMPAGVLARVQADIGHEAECSRCLVQFSYPGHVDFEELFYQRFDLVTGAALNGDAPADSFFIDARHTIDIREAVRQYGVSAAVMQPLCRPDCPGMCAECGQDLNLGRCGCVNETLDPRWEALEALRRR